MPALTESVPSKPLLSPLNVVVPLPVWLRLPMPLMELVTERFAAELNATAPPLIVRLFHELLAPLRTSVPLPVFVRLKLPPLRPDKFASVKLLPPST